MPAPQRILDLVDRFTRNADDYRSAGYNEARVRQEFINPFFKCLGWDMDNEQGYAEAYKDVIHEDALKIGVATKAPDYCFRIGGARKFFLEAKKPAVNVKDDPLPAYQLRRYAWSAKLPLSILTDFEEFAVYDCRVKPAPSDKASAGRTLYLTYTDYAERWDDIAGIFSREAVLKGSFDKYAETAKGKKGTATVDAAFLKEIESWRERLAKDIAKRNPKLSQRELNYAVQVTIDRTIFLRMCEDRRIEQYGRLLGLTNGPAVYGRLKQVFRDADDRYNSGLFYFHTEKGRAEPPDELTPALKIDDDVLRDIIRSLYYPDCPYEFSVLPAEILGQVYEQFLGKVIRLTKGHQAKVEDKPEVKKAGGVYYTPAYIVDYIVRQTVGRLLNPSPDPSPKRGGEQDILPSPPLRGRGAGGEGVPNAPAPSPGEHSLTPKQAAKLRILDPACGSGSFLLGAYQYLLDWHRDWYEADGPAKHTKTLYQGPGGGWRLTTAEKKRILLNNIYGVDIDPQAVEVTKLSLLLKVLEGESSDTLERQRRLFHERALPDLAGNIKCGNSLIGPDFYEGQQLTLFDDEEKYRINVFDWNAAFPKIMQAGGFDAVIGNPPYVLLQDEFRDDEQLSYFRSRYSTASYKLDTYHLFIEKGLNLTTNAGRCSMITPANFLTNNFLVGLRRFLLEKHTIDHILVIDGGVFAGVSVDNAVYVICAGPAPQNSFRVIHARVEKASLAIASQTELAADRILADAHVLFTGTGTTARASIWDRVFEKGVPLGRLADVNFGKQLRDRKLFEADVVTVSRLRDIRNPYKACYTGRDVSRYRVVWNGLVCLDDQTARRGGCWDAPKQNARNKILTRQIGAYPEYALDERGYQCLNTMFMVNVKDQAINPRFLLGVLNSRLLRNLWRDRFYDRRRTFPKIKGTYLEQLPICTPDLAVPAEKDQHDHTSKLAEHIRGLHEELAKAKTPHDKTVLEAQIAATDRQIDQLVYELYGLTKEEIRIVEETV